MSGKRVVIIGAGVVGAALADELAQLGWSDVTVLDKGALPSPGGSSSHAPGLVFQINASRVLCQMAKYTAEKFKSLTFDGEPCFIPVGGLEVATSPERLAEMQRRQGLAAACGLEATLISAEECLRIQPMLNPEAVLGGLRTPADGIAKAVRAVNAQLQRAAEHGVRVLDRHEVLDILTADGRITGVHTDRGDFPADIVVCCAGIWGQRIAGMVGAELPLRPLAHLDAITEPLASLRGAKTEVTGPPIRHADGGVYYRERYDRLDIGSFEHQAIPVHVDDLLSVAEAPVMPSAQEFTPADFTGAWRKTNELFPETTGSAVAEGMNGVFSFTADDFPLIGPLSEVEGFWVCEAVWVTHSAGAARALAEWLTDGYSTTFSLHEMETGRFEPHELGDEFITERCAQNYLDVYAIKHPLQPIESPRNVRTSPFHARQQELGAEFTAVRGWEQPQWYTSNNALVDDEPVREPHPWARKYWSPIVAAEARATRNNVAMFDMTPLTRLEVSGSGATGFLDRMLTRSVDRPVGTVTYCLMLDEGGRIRSDITVTRLSADSYQVGANGPLDLAWMLRNIEPGEAVSVRDITSGTCCVGVWGPQARALVSEVTELDLDSESFPYFQARQAIVAGVPVTMIRLSYVGELGWEIYTTSDYGLRLWDGLWEAGRKLDVIAAGRGAFASLRLEKGYRAFGQDMTIDHDPFEAGLGFAVKFDGRDFIGRQAAEKRSLSVERTLVPLVLREKGAVVSGREPVFSGSTAIGYVTSAAYGYTIDAGIAYAWVPAEYASPGTELDIAYFGETIPARVAVEPLFDPMMTRLKS